MGNGYVQRQRLAGGWFLAYGGKGTDRCEYKVYAKARMRIVGKV